MENSLSSQKTELNLLREQGVKKKAMLAAMNENLENLTYQQKSISCTKNPKMGELEQTIETNKDNQILETMTRNTFSHIIERKRRSFDLKMKDFELQKKELEKYQSMSASMFDFQQ